MIRTLCGSLITLAACLAAGGGTLPAAQDSPTEPRRPPPEQPPPAATAPPEQPPGAMPPLADDRPPLRPGPGTILREGSLLVEVKGSMQRDAATGWWMFDIPPETGDQSPQSLVMLPCAVLSEMQRIVESMPAQETLFQVTGEVYVYRSRNFLLPGHAPVIGYAAPGVAAADASRTQPPESPAPAGGSDSVEEIMRELARTVGPVARSTAAADPDSAATAGRTRERTTVRDGAGLVTRRGRLTRSDHGAWTFTFDADAEGLADPPMIILPCLMLESMERLSRRHGPTLPLLVSGRAFAFAGRNYLLPSACQMARELTPLAP
jgi:hypothetical protein